jgi:hypothetical protein
VAVWTGLCWLRIETGESDNQPFDSIKRGEFLDQPLNRLASQEGLCSVE